MKIGKVTGFRNKYPALVLAIGLLFISFVGLSQSYNPSLHTTSNKSFGMSQAGPTDARSFYWDLTNLVYRDYASVNEVWSYLNLSKYRQGGFPIYIHNGGILGGNGVWVGGTRQVWWFRDSTGNANLVRWYTDSSGIAGGPFFAVANNLSEGVPATIKTNLSLNNLDNTSDATKWAATATLTNKTISGAFNTFQNIPNSALTNNSIGISIGTSGTDIGVTTTPAALGSSLLIQIPSAGVGSRGALTATDWNKFNNKVDSTSINSGDSVYDWRNGTPTFRYVISAPPGTGITSLNGLTATVQNFATGTTGTDFNIVSGTATHTFNFPNSSASNRGLLTSTDWSTFNNKQPAGNYITALTTDVVTSGFSAGSAIATIQPNAVTTGKINNNAVTYAKIQAASGQSILGATGAGNFGEITLGTNLSMTGSVLNATGGVGSIPPNIGAGFRIYSPQVPGFRSLFCSGCVLDSTTNTNALTIIVSGGGGGITQLFSKNDAIGILGTDTVKMDTTKYQRIFNVTNPKYNLNPNEAVDATAAVQAVINDCYANGGGVVLFPARTYVIGGPLITSTPQGQNPNAQITIPFTSLRAANAVSMELRGDRPPSYEKSIVTTGYVPPAHGYTIFLSNIVGSGTTPAVFGNVDSLFGTQRWNATAVTWRNMIVRTTTKTSGGADTVGTMSAMNMQSSTEIQMIDFVADVTSEAFTSVMPASTTVGIWLPHANNSAWNYLSRVQIQGYFTGLNANEHTFADYLFISACDTAIQCDDMNHDIHIVRLLLNGTVHGIHATNNCYVKVDNFDTEHMIPSCRTVWYEFKDDISTETTYGIIGNINYTSVRSCGSPHPEDFTVVNHASTTLSPPNISWSYLNQSPLPMQTLIGNGAVTTNPVFNQPNSAGITINSYKGRDAEMMYMANSDSTNQYYAEGVINAKNQKAPWTNVGTKYLGVNSVQFVEKFLRPSDTASVTALTRDAYEFKLGVPIVLQQWTAATRQTLGLVNGSMGANSDSTYGPEWLEGATWHMAASRDWVRTNFSGAVPVSNVGSGYRWVIPNSNTIKTFFCSGCTLDSTTNANALTMTVTGTTPPNGGSGFRIYSPQVPELRSLFCVGCTLDSTSNLHGLTITVPAVSGLQSVITNNPALTVSNYITGNTKTLTFTAFDSIGFTANYYYTNQAFNINASVPTMKFNSSAGAIYGSYSISSVTAEARDFLTSGSWFHTWYTNNAERMRLNAAGNLLLATVSDSLSLLQIAPATAARAQIFLAPTATGPNGTNIKNGMIWYDSVLHGLFIRDQGVSKNLLTSSGAPFADNTALVKNNADNTKLLILSAASITTGTTRTATFPDANITVADKLTGLNQFASTTSAQLAGVISDETGTGVLVFGTSPSIATPLLTGLTSSGANDSVVTVDPTTGQTHRRSGIFNLYAANGLSISTVIADSIYFGGILNQTTSIAGAGFTMSLGTSGSNLGGISIYSTGALIMNGGQYNSSQGAEILGQASTINNPITAASGTVSNFSAYAFLAPTVTSTNASITYNNPATLRIDNSPTMSTNSTASGLSYSLDVAAGISHFGVGGSNFSSIFDGVVMVNGAAASNTAGLGIGASTTTAAALRIYSGADPTGGVLTSSGMMWYNGTNLYFVDGSSTGVKRDILNGVHNYVHTIFTPSTGGTVNLVNNQYNIINPTGTLATLTVNLPSSPNNNDVVYIKYTQQVTSVTYANGTVADIITLAPLGGLIIYTYDQSANTWY